MSQNRLDQLQAEIAGRIGSILKQKGWSMSHFARLAGLSKGNVSDILGAKRNLTLASIAKMEDALGKKIIDVK